MGLYGGDQCQKRVQELEEELKQCQAAIVTCGPTAAPTAKPTGAPGICSDETEYSHLVGKPCLAVWTTDDSAACEVDQYGCPSTACDGSDKPWCMMEDGLNWCYCE